jgi:lysophospholipase L1-like esterase
LLALGDSYTIGEGVADEDRWPNQLARLMRAQGVGTADPVIIARTAWTTDELLDAIRAEKLRGSFDLVFVLAGVNDQYRSRPVRAFTNEFALLLRKATTFARRRPSRVIAMSIPDWGATPFAEGRDRALIRREIEAYNEGARELALTAGVRWVDITAVTRRMQHESNLVTADGLHPSAAMYGLWASQLLVESRTALSRTPTRTGAAH